MPVTDEYLYDTLDQAVDALEAIEFDVAYEYGDEHVAVAIHDALRGVLADCRPSIRAAVKHFAHGRW